MNRPAAGEPGVVRDAFPNPNNRVAIQPDPAAFADTLTRGRQPQEPPPRLPPPAPLNPRIRPLTCSGRGFRVVPRLSMV